MRTSPKKIIVLFFAVLLAALFLLKFFWPQDKAALLQNSESKKEIKYAAINGNLVSKEISELRPLAVMVENHPDARPQSGLGQADIVYEALAEGGITRFLALYQSNEASIIGPVRSAREYYAQIADEWGALFAHVGGSNEVIAQIKSGVYKNLDDANEYYNFDFFPRRKNKPEPHHIFTSTEKLRQLIKFHQFSPAANFKPWSFKDDSAAATSTVSKINLDFSRPGYEVGWEYDAASNSYLRQQYFAPHLDELTGKPISAKTVVIQIVQVTPVPRDPLLSVDIDLISGGRVLVFMDGALIEGVWRKEAGRTRFFDSSNKEIKFSRGPLWIELVPKEKESGIKIDH